MKAVLDTNVLVSAFIFPGGSPEMAFRSAIEGRLDIVTSTALLAEFGRVLTEKFGRDPRAVRAAVVQVASLATVVTPVERVEQIQEDPDDDRVLDAALAGDVDVIISGDKHLRRLKTWRGIRVLSPADFIAEFEPR